MSLFGCGVEGEVREEVIAMPEQPKHPMQPIYLDKDGTPRFKANSLVRFILDAGRTHGIDLNFLTLLPNIPLEDWEQFHQLLGDSVSYYGDVLPPGNASVALADEQAGALLDQGGK